VALAEAGVETTSRLLDIHLAKQQLSDAYRQRNPHITVPTLRGPGLLLADSAEIWTLFQLRFVQALIEVRHTPLAVQN